MKKQCGFTLVEILVALLILATMGGMMGIGLKSAIRTYHRISIKSERLSQVQSAIILMERDIAQIINRPIIDNDSSRQPAVLLKIYGGKYELEFTHAGFINPFAAQKRSTLQRVSYSLKDKTLIRKTWQVLDRVSDTTAETEELLSDVNAFTVKLWYAEPNQGNKVVLSQKPPQPTNQASIALPAVVEFFIDTDVGVISRYILIAG